MISSAQLEEFARSGFLVVENVLTSAEVGRLRERFHAQLASRGLNHAKVLAGEEAPGQGARLKGEASNIFYARWKMDAHLDPRVYECSRDLLVQTFGSGKREGFEHPFGAFDDVLAYVDRVCYRLPDHVRAEGGLELHLDRNPRNPYLLNANGVSTLTKWRPIQAFLALTDHVGAESGGLRVVPYFSREDPADYFGEQIFDGKGEFCRLHDKSHVALQRRLEPVLAPRGSLVFWDNRTPHATCRKLVGPDTREVVYIGFLPRVALNVRYVERQALHLRRNLTPPAYCDDGKEPPTADRDWEPHELSAQQRRLLLL